MKGSILICAGYELYSGSRQIEESLFGIYSAGLSFALARKVRENKVALRPLEKIWGMDIEEVIKRIKSVRNFDQYFTVGIQGYKTPDDYYRHASLGKRLQSIKIPTLLLSTIDDPILSY